MKLRYLEEKDAPFMLEWMHDRDAVEHLQGRFLEKKLEDCLQFIENSRKDSDQLHLAVVDETDTYMGTVSLKHIDRQRSDAEFAIAIRRCAMGNGFSRFGMERILALGLTELGLQNIFWCVSPENSRAVRFYDKGNYPRVDAQTVDACRYYTEQQAQQLAWYCVSRRDIEHEDSDR